MQPTHVGWKGAKEQRLCSITVMTYLWSIGVRVENSLAHRQKVPRDPCIEIESPLAAVVDLRMGSASTASTMMPSRSITCVVVLNWALS
jgi:hypothetical protein